MTQELKDTVRQKYGEAALRAQAGAKGGCCGTSCGCGDTRADGGLSDPITRDLYDSAEPG